ncbi:MAG: tetratricopeptide repeat protein [Chloroflexota bacterium]|nr:tetratricopeptide repeat protein [Chloroflexota bacterium]
MSDPVAAASDDELAELLDAWMSTQTWQESHAMLQQHAQELLSDKAFSLLEGLLAQVTKSNAEDEEQKSDEADADDGDADDEATDDEAIEEDEEDRQVIIRELQRHLAILTAARADTIDAAYAELLKPPPSLEAFERLPEEIRDLVSLLLTAQNVQELIEQVTQHPILLTPEALTAIEKLIAELREVGEERTADALQERFETLQQIEIAEEEPGEPVPDELVKLFQAWIDTDTWEESYEFLKNNAVRLLNAEALSALDRLITWSGKNEGLKKTLEQHWVILDKALSESIDAAYAEHLQISKLYTVANVLMGVATPWQLQQAIAQYPQLLEDETIAQLFAFAKEREESGQAALAQALQLRLYEVQRVLHQQQEQPEQPSRTGSLRRDTGELSIQADREGIAVYDNSGTINQIKYDKQPGKEWQQPGRQSFRERKGFVGRQDKVNELLHHLGAGENVAITGKAAALQGMGGIGKTYLARKLAVELQDQLPGGSIWISLGPQARGKAGAQLPLSELAKYAFGGSAPGTPVGQLQPEVVKAWLEEMAPGRLLVILDDVWDADALTILEQALPEKAIQLVTTRYATIAEIAGGHKVVLGKLSREDGLALLLDRLGEGDTPNYQADLGQLVDLLEGHALALDIAAGVIKKPSRLRSILQDLRQELGRGELNSLKFSEERDSNLERSLALSYQQMRGEQRTRFRALGVFATETLITPEAAGAVWNIEDLATIKKALFELEDFALLTEAPGTNELCYQQHGLLRAYARALLEKENELISASWAHANYYTELVTNTPVVESMQLDQHLPDLLAAIRWTVEHEPPLFARLLSASSQFLINRGQSMLLESYLPQAIQIATETGNTTRLANLLKSLGDLEGRLGHLDQARAHYDAALPHFQAERDQLGEANLLTSLGDLERRLGHLDQARAHYDAALPLYRAERSQLGEANIYQSIVSMFVEQQNWAQSQAYCEQALPLYIAERDVLGQANTLHLLGRSLFELGEYQQAIGHMQQAIERFHRVQDKEWEEYAQQDLAEMQARLELAESSSDQKVALSKETWHALLTLLQFWNADLDTRYQLLKEQASLLLSESVASLFMPLQKMISVMIDSEDGAREIVERVKTLLLRCRTWGPDVALYFAAYMRVGDNIEIPTAYEDTVRQVATLLAHQQGDDMERAVALMQDMLDRLTADAPALFEAALLCDLAKTKSSLPGDHPAYNLAVIEAHYREALPLFETAQRPLNVVLIQRSLTTLLSEQGRYQEALEPLKATIQLLQAEEKDEEDTAWTLSDYAYTLGKLGRLEEALSAYGEAIRLLPDEPILYRNRAETLIQVRRLDEAEADLARAVELAGNEESAYLWMRRTQLAIARGDSALAEQMVAETVARDEKLDVTFLQAQIEELRKMS